MKKVTLIISALLVIALSCSCLFACKGEVQEKNDRVFKGFNVAPTDEGVDVAAMYEDGIGDPVTLAADLYAAANRLDKEIDQRMYYSTSPSENVAAGMNNVINLDIVEMKSGTEYFRIDYRLKYSVPLFNAMPSMEEQLNNALELVCTERRYVDTATMTAMKYQKTNNAKLDEALIPYADWTTLKVDEDREVPIFNAEQEGDYEKSAHKINVDTIAEATVEYDATAKVYRVNLELALDGDEPEATINTRKNIADGSGDPNAKFETIKIMFEVYENGYYRYFETQEFWSGKAAGIIGISSSFYYKDHYSYDADDCNIATYADSKLMKEALAA